LQKIIPVFFRWTSALFLIFVFMARSFSYYVFEADYYLNTSAYIAHCVNKDKPWMHCNGRCQLHKQIKQQQDNSDKQAPERRIGNEGPLSCNSFFAAVPEVYGLLIERSYPEYMTGNTISVPRSLFHPPGYNPA
jgi:hypothetical protein